MLKAQHHTLILTLVVLTNIGLAIFNFSEVFSGNGKYVGVGEVALFDIRPIENMKVLFTPEATDVLTKFEPWAENPKETTGLTDLQTAKFHLGCYASVAGDSHLTPPWQSEAALTAWTGADDITRTAALHALQDASGGFGERSVCSCIDSMLFSRMDDAVVNAEVSRLVPGNLDKFVGLDSTLARQVDQYLVSYADKHVFDGAAATLLDPFALLYDVSGVDATKTSKTITSAEFVAWAADATVGEAFYDDAAKRGALYTNYANTTVGNAKQMSRTDFYKFMISLDAVKQLTSETGVTKGMVTKWITKFGLAGASAPQPVCDASLEDCDGTNSGDPKITSAALWKKMVDEKIIPDLTQSLTALVTADIFADIFVPGTPTSATGTGTFRGKGMANFHMEDEADKLREAWTEKHAHESTEGYTNYGKETAAYKQDVVQFCVQNAMPQMQTTYEGMVNVNSVLFVGIFLVLGSVMREFNYKMLLGASEDNTNHRLYWDVFTSLLVLSGCLVTLITWLGPMIDFSEVGTLNWRDTEMYSTPSNVVGALFNALYLMIGLVEAVYLVRAIGVWTMKNENTGTTQMYDEVHTFFLFVGGWLSIGIATLLQANYKHINTNLAFIVIIAGASLLQTISNYMNKIYMKLFEFLDKRQAEVVSTHDKLGLDTANNISSATTLKALNKFRALMQFIGWTRLFVAVAVILHIIFLVTLGRESATTSPTQSLHDGRLLYFAIAFFVALCLLDLLCETLPFVFARTHARYLRIYFVFTYILYINITQLMYIITNMDSKWLKPVLKVE